MSGEKNRDRAILQAIPDMLFVFDQEGVILDFKPAKDLTPFVPPEEFLGRKITEVLPEDIAEPTLDLIGQALAAEEERYFEYEMLLEEEVKRSFEARLTPLEEGEVLVIVRDITDRVKSDEALVESEARYRRLFEDNPLPMYIYDVQDLSILAINDAMVASYGFSRDELLRMSMVDIRPEEQAEEVVPHVRELAPGMVYTGVWSHRKKDGTVIDVDITSADFPYENRRTRLVICNDVTVRLKIEEELKRSEDLYRRLFDDNPMPMMIFDIDSLRILAVNEATERHYGWSREEFLGMTVKDIRPPEDVNGAVKQIRSMTEDLDNVGIWRHRKKDGTVMDVDITSHTITFEDRNARLALCHDVTDRLAAERELSASEERFRTIFRYSPESITLTRESDGIIVDVSDGFTATTGYSREEAVGRSRSELDIWIDPDNGPSAEGDIFGVHWGGEGVQQAEIPFRRKDGSRRLALFSLRRIFLEGKPHILTVARDITELKLAEAALKESEEKFRTVFQTSPDAISVHSGPKGIFVDVNEMFTTLTGYAREEVLGKTVWQVGVWDNPEDRDRLVESLDREGRAVNIEAPFRVKDGSVRMGLLSSTRIMLNDEPHHISITKDITGEKEYRERIRNSLREKEVLLKEIHHRVKNNLQVISGLLNLQSHYIDDDEVRGIYRESQNRVISMALIHEELYQREDLARVNVPGYISNLCENLFTSYGVKGDSITLDLNVEDVRLVVDTAIPCGLIINELVSNSLKHAFPDGRRGRITIAFQASGEREYSLVVRDDGIGFPRGVDYRRTKSLGMQLVTVLVEQLGGKIHLKRGGGTEFLISFGEYLEAGTELH